MPFNISATKMIDSLARLRLSNGTQKLSLLSRRWGFHLEPEGWRPAVAQLKDGGVWQSSPLSDGRRLMLKQYDNVIETFNLTGSEVDQDNLIAWLNLLQTMIGQAQDYWVSGWRAPVELVVGTPSTVPQSPVWLEVRAERERYSRYAIIHSASIPDLTNPFGGAFNSPTGALLDNLTLIIERGQWQSEPPPNATRIYSGAYSINPYTGRHAGDITVTAEFNPSNAANFISVGNSIKVANLTHVFNFEASGPTFSANALDANLPYYMLPFGTVAVNDAVYYGSETTGDPNSGPFTSLVHYFDTAGGGYTIVWEYWNGAWVALDVMDNTNGLKAIGRNTINWRQQTDWLTTAVNGVTGYWVRARVTAAPGPILNPRQNLYTIYSVNWPFVEIHSDQVPGEMPALINLSLRDLSDRDGTGVLLPDLWANRVIVGLRSLSRNSAISTAFQAYMNISDEQWPGGTSVTVGTNTTFQDNVYAPTGRAAVYNPTIDNEPVADRAIVRIGAGPGASWYGTYRVFVRAMQDTGNVGEIVCELAVDIGDSSFEVYRSEQRTFPVIGGSNLLDFGSVTIPPETISDMLLGGLMQCEFNFRVRAGSVGVGSAAAGCTFFDLVLIPTDEWSGDFIDIVAGSKTGMSRFTGIHSTLTIDSARYQKGIIRAITYHSEVGAVWRAITAAQAQLQANANQRLWFLTARRFTTTYDEDDWRSNHEYMMGVSVEAVLRYLTMRGAT